MTERERLPNQPDPDGYDAAADFAGSLLEAYRAIRERMAGGGLGWTPKLRDHQGRAVDPAMGVPPA